MNDAERKELTEFLDECFHKVSFDGKCTICKNSIYNKDGWRTFDTPQDMVDLTRKMVEKGAMSDFLDYTYRKIAREVEQVRRGPRGQQVTEIDGPIYMIWGQYLLVNPERFCQLCYDSEVWKK